MTVLVTSSRRHLGMPFAAALAVGAAVLAGCQSNAEPPVGTTPAASVSPSASASSSSPASSPSPSVKIPAAAREKSEKGAEAFVRYFFDQVNRAWTEPDPSLIESLSDEKCDFCVTTGKTAAALEDAEQHYASAPVTVRGVEPLSGAPKDQVYLFVDLLQNRANIVTESGKVVATDKERSIPSNVALSWHDGSWAMFAVEQTP